MKKETIVFTVFFICAALTFSAADARAVAVSTSTAWIDWTSLTVSGDITWSDKGSESYAYTEDDAGSDENYQDEPGWVDTSASASVYHAYGDAYTNDDALYEEVYAIAKKATTMWAYAEAYGCRWGSFTASSNGWVTFSADYELWQQLLTNYVGEWAYGHAETGLSLVNDDTSGWDEDNPWLENEVWDGGSITDSDEGQLTAALWFNAGNTGYFEVWVFNNAETITIPEPATITMLLVGSLVFIGKKQQKTK